MNSGKTIFSQLIDFLSPYEFRQCVQRYNGNFKIKSFSCWDQFLCLAFAVALPGWPAQKPAGREWAPDCSSEPGGAFARVHSVFFPLRPVFNCQP